MAAEQKNYISQIALQLERAIPANGMWAEVIRAHSPQVTPLKGEHSPFPEAEDGVMRAISDHMDRGAQSQVRGSWGRDSNGDRATTPG